MINLIQVKNITWLNVIHCDTSMSLSTTMLLRDFYLLHGYPRCFVHDLTPYSAKKRELTQDIFNQLKWVQCCTLATSDVIIFVVG